MKGGEKPVDLGNEFKGAVSDATKKAAQSLGVGIYLARSDEALELEAAESVDPKVEAAWANFKSVADSLTDEQRMKLGEFWVKLAHLLVQRHDDASVAVNRADGLAEENHPRLVRGDAPRMKVVAQVQVDATARKEPLKDLRGQRLGASSAHG